MRVFIDRHFDFSADNVMRNVQTIGIIAIGTAAGIAYHDLVKGLVTSVKEDAEEYLARKRYEKIMRGDDAS